LRDAVDLDDALLERELVGIDPWHLSLLELQSRFAGCIRERLDPAVVAEAGAIEDDRLDAGGLRPLGDELADRGGIVGLRPGRRAELLLEARRGDERLAGAVVDDLGRDVLEAPEDGQPRPGRFAAQAQADPLVALLARRGAAGARGHFLPPILPAL